jgi:isopenicillin N synthase-like dioxygenase
MSTSVVTISYQDLLDFQNSQSCDELSHRLVEQIGQAYGSEGLGILSVSGIPNVVALRQQLLPLAAKIPQLPDLDRCVVEEACYAVGWSHGKEEFSGEPDVAKGSFYANPLANNLHQSMLKRRQLSDDIKDKDYMMYEAELARLVQDNYPFFAPNVFPDSLPELEGAIADMGQLIARVGRMIARICEHYCERQGVKVQLEKILNESLNCKARLLHYFATSDFSTVVSEEDEKKDETSSHEWICGWHRDHGSLTGLVTGMYLTEATETCGQDPMQLSAPPNPKAGLYIQARSKELIKIDLPSDCLGFQIGETFQILSGGLLQATPHAVKSIASPGVTREAFAVFLEPEFDYPMDIPKGRTVDDCCPPDSTEANRLLKLNSIKSRWKEGMCFGEFNNITIQTFHKQLVED